LSTVLAGKVVDRAAIEAVLEEVKKMGNIILEVAESVGERRGRVSQKEETARKMLLDNLDVLDIIKYTGIDAERLKELRNVINDEPASA